jgi:hypothetical protein
VTGSIAACLPGPAGIRTLMIASVIALGLATPCVILL